MVVVTFLTIIASWQESVMGSHIIGGMYRYRDSIFSFTIGMAQFMMIRAIAPDVNISYWFFVSVLFLLIGVAFYLNQSRSIETKGPRRNVLDTAKVQIRRKAMFLFFGAISALAFGLLVLFIHDPKLNIALIAVSLLMQINTLRQEAVSWNRIFRNSNQAAVYNLPEKEIQ